MLPFHDQDPGQRSVCSRVSLWHSSEVSRGVLRVQSGIAMGEQWSEIVPPHLDYRVNSEGPKLYDKPPCSRLRRAIAASAIRRVGRSTFRFTRLHVWSYAPLERSKTAQHKWKHPSTTEVRRRDCEGHSRPLSPGGGGFRERGPHDKGLCTTAV